MTSSIAKILLLFFTLSWLWKNVRLLMKKLKKNSGYVFFARMQVTCLVLFEHLTHMYLILSTIVLREKKMRKTVLGNLNMYSMAIFQTVTDKFFYCALRSLLLLASVIYPR